MAIIFHSLNFSQLTRAVRYGWTGHTSLDCRSHVSCTNRWLQPKKKNLNIFNEIIYF